jgi:hypothetical protein
MFLKCQDRRIDFVAESLQFVPRGTKLEVLPTILVLQSSGAAASCGPAIARLFATLRDDHHVVHAWVDTSSTAADSSPSHVVAGAIEEFCRKLEVERLVVASAGMMIPAALSLVSRAPALVSKLILFSDATLPLSLDAQRVRTLVLDSSRWPHEYAESLVATQQFLRT